MKPIITRWNFRVGDDEHMAEYHHWKWTGARAILIDGEEVKRTPGSLAEASKFVSTLAVDFRGKHLDFVVRSVGRAVFYELLIDGAKVECEEGEAFGFNMFLVFLVVAAAIGIAAAYFANGGAAP